jgi:hypothetical protein
MAREEGQLRILMEDASFGTAANSGLLRVARAAGFFNRVSPIPASNFAIERCVQLVNMGGAIAVTDGGPGTMSRLGAWITIVKCNWGIGMMAMPFMLHSAGKLAWHGRTHTPIRKRRMRSEGGGAEVRADVSLAIADQRRMRECVYLVATSMHARHTVANDCVQEITPTHVAAVLCCGVFLHHVYSRGPLCARASSLPPTALDPPFSTTPPQQ